ncbi:kinase-like domain-containing protein [Suillus lakei]|nr:kinase-like domain-containing protein [Suillus lakei]
MFMVVPFSPESPPSSTAHFRRAATVAACTRACDSRKYTTFELWGLSVEGMHEEKRKRISDKIIGSRDKGAHFVSFIPPVIRYLSLLRIYFAMGDLLPESVEVKIEPIPIPATQESVKFKIEPILIPATDIEKVDQFPGGSGAIGDVWKCLMSTQSGTQRLVAVKFFRVQASDEVLVKIARKRIRREMYVWMQLEHDYILPFEGVTIAAEFGPLPALISPWMEEGSLDNYLKHKFLVLTDVQKRELIRQVATGVSYLHRKGIVHGDLTATNVLVDSRGCVRLADFGQSIILVEAPNPIMAQSNPAFSYHTGAARWVAPELLEPPEDQPIQCATKSTDIYALGGIMLQVSYGKQPYWWLKTAIQVVSAKLKRLEPINSSIEIQPDHLNLMRRCWSMESEVRPSVEEVMNYIQEALFSETSSV